MEAKQRKVLAYGDLSEKILSKGFCTLCGACEAACPVHAIKVDENGARQVEDCSQSIDMCPICYDICPHTESLMMESRSFLLDTPRRHESLGYYRKICFAQSTDAKMRKQSRGGGVITSLLSFALKSDIIDSAIASEVVPSSSLETRPLIATVPDDVMSALDSKFSPSPVARAFGMAVYEYGKNRVAFVGLPCHVLAIRKLEAWQHRFVASLRVTLGLFCLWTFSIRALLEHLATTHNLEASRVTRLDLERELKVQTDSGVLSIQLEEARSHILEGCRTCGDFTAEFADISIGGAGPLTGWSTVVIRTRVGEELFERAIGEGTVRVASPEEHPEVFAHIIEMSTTKKRIALEETGVRERAGQMIPPSVLPPAEFGVLSSVRIEDAMTKNVVTMTKDLTAAQLLEVMLEHHHLGYPVVDELNNLIGVVTFEDLTKVSNAERDSTKVGEIMKTDLIVGYPDEPILDAFERMTSSEIGRIFVVDRRNPKRLLGILTRSDIFHALQSILRSG
jgi:coenzyme F420 hydrogenase subunit beta